MKAAEMWEDVTICSLKVLLRITKHQQDWHHFTEVSNTHKPWGGSNLGEPYLSLTQFKKPKKKKPTNKTENRQLRNLTGFNKWHDNINVTYFCKSTNWTQQDKLAVSKLGLHVLLLQIAMLGMSICSIFCLF